MLPQTMKDHQGMLLLILFNPLLSSLECMACLLPPSGQLAEALREAPILHLLDCSTAVAGFP